MRTQNKQKGNVIFWLLIVGAITWGVSSLGGEEKSYEYDSSSSSYDSYRSESPSYEEYDTQTFYGYDCTQDCSGHEAGYNWAEENDISDEYDCDGNSNSFNEGCTAYVEENY